MEETPQTTTEENETTPKPKGHLGKGFWITIILFYVSLLLMMGTVFVLIAIK
jgi:hypothetical protein